MRGFELHHVSLRTGSDALADKCVDYYCSVLGMRVVRPAPLFNEQNIVYLADAAYPDRTPLQIVGRCYHKDPLREQVPFLNRLCFLVDCLDDAFEDLSADGVNFHVEPNDQNGLYFARCSDPAGIEIEIRQRSGLVANLETGMTLKEIPVKINHVGILAGTSKMARKTETFYVERFGMREVLRGESNQEGMDWVYLQDSSGKNPFWLEIVGDLFFDQEKEFIEKYETGMDHLSFEVFDANAVYQMIKNDGEKIEIEPFDFGGMRMFYVKDPCGTMVQFIQPPDPIK